MRMALRSSTARGLIALVLGLCAMPGEALADRLAAAPARLTGAVSPGLREGFAASLAGGLSASGHEVVTGPELEQVLAENPALARCDTDTCLDRLGQLLGARAVLRSAIEVLGSSNYHLHLELYELTTHSAVGSLDDNCTVCTVHEAKEALSRAAAALARRLPATTVNAALPGPRLATPAPAHAATVATPRSKLFLGLGVSALVLGLGSLGGGTALLVLDGRAQDGFDAQGQPERTTLDTRLSGALVTAAGGLLVLGGGLLLWRSQVARRPPSR